jgi:hypothetical protein
MANTSGGSAAPPNIRRTMAPPLAVSIRSGNIGSWKNATYTTLGPFRAKFGHKLLCYLPAPTLRDIV